MAAGEPLVNVSIPPVGTPGTEYATRINSILTNLVYAIGEKVPFSSLSGTELDLNNIPVKDSQYVQFYNQPVVPGASPLYRLEMFGNELYWVGASGAVKLTSGGGINAGSVGGIGGNYGGVDAAAVNWVRAGPRYEFYDNFSTLTWAVSRGLGIDIAGGATSTSYAQLRYSGASSLNFSFATSHPASLRSVMLIDSTGQMFHNDATNLVTNDIKLSSTSRIVHGNRTISGDFVGGYVSAGSILGALNSYGVGIKVSLSASTYKVQIPTQVGWRIQNVVVRVHKSDLSSMAMSLDLNTITSAVVPANLATGATASASFQSVTLSGANTVMTTGKQLMLTVTPPTTSDILYSYELTYDVV